MTSELELVTITLTWQPPLGLVIDNGLMYVISINVSIQNLTNQFEVVTNNLSYSHTMSHEFTMEKENNFQLCMLSYNNIVIVSLSSKNKVGIGRRIQKPILLDSLCTNGEYTMPRIRTSVSESGLCMAIYMNSCVIAMFLSQTIICS